MLPLRWRLTIWYSVLLLVVLGATGILIYMLLSHNLLQEVDGELSNRGSEVHSVLTFSSSDAGTPHIMPTQIEPPSGDFASPSIYVQVTDEHGTVLVRSTNLSHRELPLDPDAISGGLAGRPSFSTLRAEGNERIRLLTLPLIHGQQVMGLVQVGESLHQIDATLGRLSILLGSGIAMVWFFASFVGWSLAGRALRTVSEISRTADQIAETQDFAQRLSYRGPRDEVGELASTFNRMIARIDRTFEAQRQFVANSSHELGTPLTVIRGNVDLLKRDLAEEDRRECLAAIESASTRMDRIIGDLLTLATLDDNQGAPAEAVDLRSLIRDVYNETRICTTQHALEIGRLDALHVLGHRERLRELLVNLVENAVKYTPDGGRITLTAQRDHDWAYLSVSDTGVGIAREHLERIFDRFYRVDKARSRSKGGTGLGLSIVKAIALAHGGSVQVRSEVGRGSIFSVLLPLANNDSLA